MRITTLCRDRLMFLLCVPILGGCLHFETQSIDFRHDAATDTAVWNLVYHGLYWDKDNGGPEALKRAVDGDEFCLVDWPLHIQRKKLLANDEPLAQMIGKNLKVERVGFFKNARGQLSGGQIVTLTDVGGVLKMVNGLVNQWLAKEEGRPGWDRHTAARLMKAVKADHSWFRMQGNAIALHGFLSDHDYEKFKRQGMRKVFQTKAEDYPTAVEWVARMPLSFSRDGMAVTIVLGNPGGQSRLEVPHEGRKPYQDNLLAFAKETWGFELDRKVGPLLVEPDGSALSAFATAMSLRERVRILLAIEGDAATARLAGMLEELPETPDLGEGKDVRTFWRARLAEMLQRRKPAPEQPKPDGPKK